jgi:hypothetical protein
MSIRLDHMVIDKMVAARVGKINAAGQWVKGGNGIGEASIPSLTDNVTAAVVFCGLLSLRVRNANTCAYR